MRVIAGSLKGSPLETADGHTTRPITDRVKESLFSVLGSRFGTLGALPPVDVLDVFGGSGALGIESLSRGTRACVFVERDRRAVLALRANLERLKLKGITRVAVENAWTMRVPAPAGGALEYGLIFVDPPYKDAEQVVRVQDLLERLATRLAPDGVIVFRHEIQTEFDPEPLQALCAVDARKWGRMRVWLLMRRETVEAAEAEFAESASMMSEGDIAEGEQIEEEDGADDVGNDADR